VSDQRSASSYFTDASERRGARGAAEGSDLILIRTKGQTYQGSDDRFMDFISTICIARARFMRLLHLDCALVKT